jgi:hypothetical protein
MSNGEPIIKILKLKVRGKDIEYTVCDGYLDGKEMPTGGDYEPLKPDKLQEATINLLSQLLQQMAKRVRQSQPQDEEFNTFNDLIEVLGGQLYTVLFKGKVHNELDQLRKMKQDVDLLRIELEFVEGGLFASWPWEYLWCPVDETFLALETQLVLNRKLSLRPGNWTTLSTRQPIDVLVVASNPHFPEHLRGVHGDVVIEALEDLKKTGTIKIGKLHQLIEPQFELRPDYTPTVTFEQFGNMVQEHKPHIIHFIGHGQRNPHGGGQIALVKEGGNVDWVDDDEFAKMAEGGLPNLKLVFLQVCESALPDPYMGISGVAQRLAQRGIPAVVAMQYKIDKEEADNFAMEFYRSLASGSPVDMAVKEGRDALYKQGRHHHAFGLPVLYLRSYESMILPETLPPPRPGVLATPTVCCPRCNKPLLQENQKGCPYCGMRFVCINCGETLLDPLGNFCTQCFTEIKQVPWEPPLEGQQPSAQQSRRGPPVPARRDEPPAASPGRTEGLKTPGAKGAMTGKGE